MKKIIIILGLGIFLISGSTFATEFPSSGIDLNNSTVSIMLDTSGVATPVVGYSCTSEQTMGNNITFTDAGWNEATGEFENLTDCFYSAGDYTLDIHLVDNASNESNYTETFTIFPGTPTDGSLNGDCSNKTANNSDECTFTLILTDANGNTVTNQNPTVFSPTSGPDFTNGEFTDDANTGVKFREGLRLKENSFSVLPNNSTGAVSLTGNYEFTLKAIAPSIQKVGETISELSGDWLSNVIPRSLDFSFTNLKEVNLDGSVSGNPTNDVTVRDKNVTFSNPFFAKPSLSDLEHEKLVTATINTDKKSGVTITSQDPKTVTLSSVLGSFCDLTQIDPLETGPNPLSGYAMSNCNDILYQYNPGNINSTAHSESYDRVFDEPGSAVIGENSAALITNIAYTLGGEDVSYPAGAIGGIFTGLPATTIGLNHASIDAKFIGADIEGFTSVDNEKSVLGTTNDQMLNIGLGSNKTDLYEEIVKNGFELARNSANIKTTNTGGNDLSTLFSGKDVVVVKLNSGTTFDISGTLPSGKKTLVLIDANLKINGNLVYQNTDDSFGVIILRTTAGTYPEVGNIFVASGVQKIAGSYFADGGFMNNDSNNKDNGNTALSTKQLLLEGSLLSRNTVGGSLRGAGADDYSPWSSTATNDVARRYDLHYVRRYYCDQPNNGCANAVPGETQNNAAFIIRPDQKSTILPPPGFKIQ